MKWLKKLICFFSFTLFAIMVGIAPQRAFAEDGVSVVPEGEPTVSDEISVVPEEEPTVLDEIPVGPEEEQVASDEVPIVVEEDQVVSEEIPVVPDEEQISTEEVQTSSADEETAVLAGEEQTASAEMQAASPEVSFIFPSVYVEPSTGIATASVSTMFSGAPQAQITVRLEQLRDGNWVILGESIHRETSSPAKGYYTRTWPVDHGYYYRAYAIVSLQDEDKNVLLERSTEGSSVYY